MSLRKAAEGLGYVALAVVGLGVVAVVRPGWICRIVGHEPTAWMWQTADREDAECVFCGAAISRARAASVRPTDRVG